MSRQAVALSLLAAGCSGSASVPTLVIPDTGTDWVIFATAAAMKPASPKVVHVMRTSDVHMMVLRPDNIGAGDIDMFYAGIKAEDLAEGLTPDKLAFVDKTAENARALPPLYKTYVLAKTTTWNAKNELVPTDDPALAASSTQERRDRLAVLLQDLAIQDPCMPLAAPVHVNEIAAEAVNHIRTVSSGDNYVAISATGRALIARIPKGTENPMAIMVSTGTVAVMPTDMVTMADLGDSEAQDQTGLVVPGEIAVNFVGGFGHGIGQIELWSGSKRKYVVDTPMLPPSDPVQPELFSGVRHLMLGGVASLCGFGSALGPNQVAGVWCRPAAGGAWQTVASFKNALSVVAMLPDTSAAQRTLLVDVAGTVYVSQGNGFKPAVSAAINVGCMPPCAAFQTAAIPPQASAGTLRAVIAGSSAQVLAIRDDGNAITLDPVPSVSAALFGDERPMGMSAARFTTAAYGPDGSLWLATGAPIVLLRLAPDLSSASRICLPREAQGMGINTMVVESDGRLILGLSPAQLGFGRWQ